MTDQPDLPPELLERVAQALLASKIARGVTGYRHLRRDFNSPFPADYDDARAVAPLLIAHGRESEKAEVAKRFDHIRSDLNNISRAIEDEGDRCYFGSTNDPDELRRVACDFEDWLLREERNEHRSKP